LSRFARVDGLLQRACGTRFTAAVARIERGGAPVFERAYGVTRLEPERARPVYADTRFDLASLTKLFVATLALRLVAQGRVALDGALGDVLPEWDDIVRRSVTLRMLLAHSSGMDSGADYRKILDENVERYALEKALLSAPGASVVYSDLGFIVVGTVIERVTRRSLSACIRNTFASESLGYRPPVRSRPWIPATEDDGWRGRVQGIVHDEKAFLMGGAAGHAGLFGTASDVARLTEAYLGRLHGRHSDVLPEWLVREALAEQAPDPVLRRGLGWALKTTDENSCGRLMDARSFGHTGFVGTCVWADPARDVQGVLLTNSVYFGRSDTRDLRAAFYEAMIEAVTA
jgi:beta-N-acetylhexosaminidase